MPSSYQSQGLPASVSADPTVKEELTVCICTFRRPAVRAAILSVAHQSGVDLARVRIVVVDNDEEPSARDVVGFAAQETGMRVDYFHAPAGNISIARNAALDAVATRWAAFIDDDEIASSNWLRTLLDRRDGVEVVVGRSVAVYADDAPTWLKTCDFHSNQISESPVNAYTCNVLMDTAFIRKHGVRFALEFGQTGGEDTIFFRELHGVGARFAYAPESVVFEDTPISRANMRWVLRRKFRSGQTHALMLKRFARREYFFLPLVAAAKSSACAFAAFVSLPFADKWRAWLARAALHLGAATYPIIGRTLREYKA